MTKIQGVEVQFKDSIEDAGFVNGRDPFDVLCDIHGDKFRDYRKTWGKVSNLELLTGFPLNLDFELNDTCNLRCEMCPYVIENPEAKKTTFFPYEKFKEIILEGVPKGLRAVNLNFLNEPLMRKDIPQFVRFAHENGVVDISFNSNASFLSGKMQDELLDSGMTRLQLSIDAFSAETYEKVRTGGDYQQVMDNILEFLEKKAARKVGTMLVAVTFIRMAVNEHELVPFVNFWKEKVDYIILREYVNPYSQFYENTDRRKDLTAPQRHIIKDFRCNKPWQRMAIRADGTILPCCTTFGVSIPMGNVFKESLESVWTSPPMEELRQIHKNGEYQKNSICRECAISSMVDVGKTGD